MVREILVAFPPNVQPRCLQEAHWSEQALDLSPIEWLHLGPCGKFKLCDWRNGWKGVKGHSLDLPPPRITKSFRYLKWRYGGTEPYFSLFWGVRFPLHKPYPYSLYRCSYLHFSVLLQCLVTETIAFLKNLPRCQVTKWRLWGWDSA